MSTVSTQLAERKTFASSAFAMRLRAAVGMTDVTPLIPSQWVSLTGGEPFPGAWQRNIKVDSEERLLAQSVVYGCVALIARDISKLKPVLRQVTESGVTVPTTNPAFSPVLRKPNSYQSRIQFFNYWLVSKLMFGNAYVIKVRDNRNIVVELHILDPRLVKVMVTQQEGSVYYAVQADWLAGLQGPVLIPATEIIHDRAICPFHPLIGVSPLYAAALSATQARRIQGNSSVFFENMSRPSGQLTTTAELNDETAERLKRDFEEKFSGKNIGRVLVAGSGLKFEPMTMPAEQAQLIEQLEWTGKDICIPFHVPAYKLNLGDPPTFNNIAQLAQDYYSTCLQEHIESVEILLDEGLNLPTGLEVEFDLKSLLRMDPLTRAERATKLTQAGVVSLDEARADENELPLPDGVGKVPFLQQQMYPVTVLAARKDVAPSAGNAPAAPAPAPAPAADGKGLLEQVQGMLAGLVDQVRSIGARVDQAAAEDLWRDETVKALEREFDEVA